MNIKGTKTEKNIKAAFAGESQARNKYTYFALQAKAEGQHDVAEMFEKMADNEREHAKIWFKILNNGLGKTESNILDAATGESYEWKSMYPEFAKEAREEGLEMLAVMFEKVAAIERDHEKKFLETYMKLKSNSTPTPAAKEETTHKKYRCMFCGHSDDNYLDVCPVCEAIGAFEKVTD